jgi:hypothetical protein
MRKLLLTSTSIVAVAFASQAFAGGSSSYTSQGGTGQVANIDQSGGNYDRVGSASSPFVQDNYGGAVGQNNLIVLQAGSYNALGYNYQGYQLGDQNTAEITQQGNSSAVDLRQVGSQNGRVGSVNWSNSSSADVIVQDSSSYASLVDLTQSGANNMFDIGQGGSYNRTTVNQSGDRTNQAYVRQNLAYGGNYNSIDITQVTQSQSTPTFDVNYAVAVQGGGDGNGISISQNGNSLGANVMQSGSSNVFASVQTGVNNMIGLTTGFGADTPLMQTGNSNRVDNLQGGANNTANGSQNGTSNYISNIQIGTGADASITQAGTSNYTYNVQSGANAKLLVNQNGTLNTTHSTQDGLQYAEVKQTGDGNLSTGVQSGVGLNNAYVTQGGWGGNVANYSQNGSGNITTIKQ